MARSLNHKVHLTFRAHTVEDRYHNRKAFARSQSVIFEGRSGDTPEPLSQEKINRIHDELQKPPYADEPFPETKRDRTRRKFLLDALARGKKVFAGERDVNSPYLVKVFDLEEKMRDQPTLANIRKYFQSAAREMDYRDRQVVETVKAATKPVELQYGAAHSLSITTKLKEAGFNIRRKNETGVFPWSTIVERKIILRLEPTRIEYKRAFLDVLFDLEPKGLEKDNNKSLRIRYLFRNELIKRLSESEIDKIIKLAARAEYDQKRSVVSARILLANGFRTQPTSKDVFSFLNKYSQFWKRMNFSH